jgi:hypothetical protein
MELLEVLHILCEFAAPQVAQVHCGPNSVVELPHPMLANRLRHSKRTNHSHMFYPR